MPLILLLPLIAAAAPDKEETIVLEKYETTGTRLKREQDGPTPIVRIKADDVTDEGFARPEDFLRQLPITVGGAQDTSSPTTFQPGITSVSFRGLGYASGLLLVNGRRIAPFGQAGAAQLGYDVSSVPMAGLDSIEIAKDGASAVYGSDAVAGVINYKLRTDFTGTELQTSYRQTEGTDWGYWSTKLIHGIQGSRGRLIISLEHDDNNSVLYSDRAISRSEDFRSIGGFNLSAPYTFPAHVVIPVGTPGVPTTLTGKLIAPGTIQSDGTVRLVPTSAPVESNFVPLPGPFDSNGLSVAGDTRNGLDRAPYSVMVPALHNTGAWLYGELVLTPRVTAFLDTSYRYRIVESAYEPSTISLVGEVGFGDLPGGRLVFPAANPYNPFGVDITDMSFYLPAMGARTNEMTVIVPRIVSGLKGTFADGWDWETALNFNRNTVHSRWRNFLGDQQLQDGLAGRLGGWLNPFGPSDPGVIQRMLTSQDDLQYAQLLMGDARVRGELFTLPGGPVQWVGGGEWREDRFVHRPGPLRANGGLVSLAMRPPRDLRRVVSAFYTEFSLPVTKQLEFTLAARWEQFRGTNGLTKPKYGVRWTALPGVTFRATHSEAYHAPELLQSLTDVQETFIQISDPRRPDLGVYTMRVRNGGNPALKPEETNVDYAGVVLEPKFLPGLEVSADFWRYRQRNLISTVGALQILQYETTRYVGRVDRGPSPGPGIAGEVIAINDTFGNYNGYHTQGVDLEARYRFKVGSNRFLAEITAVRLQSAAQEIVGVGEIESAGLYAYADWRMNARLTWERGRHRVTAHLNYIGRQDGGPAGPGLTGGQDARAEINLVYSFPGPLGTECSVGANNIFDTPPPRNYGSRTGYMNGVYDNLGRVWSVSIARKF